MEQPAAPTAEAPAVPKAEAPPPPEAKPEEKVEAKPEAKPEEKAEPKKDVLGTDAPEWMKKFDARGDTYEPNEDDLKNLSPEAQRVLNAMYRKSQKAAEDYQHRQSSLDARQRSIEDSQSMVAEERLRLYKLLQNDEARGAVKAPEGEAPDPFTPEGMAFMVQKEVAQRMEAYFKSLDDNIKKQQDEYQAVKNEKATKERVSAIKEFAKKNPDFVKYKDEILTLRKKMNNAISAEDAYMLLKAKKGEIGSPVQETNGVDESRKRARAATGRGSNIDGSKKGPPDGASAVEIMRYYRNNPEQMEQRLLKYRNRYS